MRGSPRGRSRPRATSDGGAARARRARRSRRSASACGRSASRGGPGPRACACRRAAGTTGRRRGSPTGSSCRAGPPSPRALRASRSKKTRSVSGSRGIAPLRSPRKPARSSASACSPRSRGGTSIGNGKCAMSSSGMPIARSRPRWSARPPRRGPPSRSRSTRCTTCPSRGGIGTLSTHGRTSRMTSTIASCGALRVGLVEVGQQPHAERDVALLVERDVAHPLAEAGHEVERLERRLDDVLAGLGERPLDDDVVQRHRLGELARRAVAAQLVGHRVEAAKELAMAPRAAAATVARSPHDSAAVADRRRPRA